MKILIALDIATRTGWCSNVGHGVFDLKVKSDESSGMKLVRFRAKLTELLTPHCIAVYERPAGLHKRSIMTESELIGVFKMYCEENEVEYRAYSATEIKKFITGRGNASKQEVLEAVNKKGYSVSDDNESDAIALYLLAKEDLKIT